MTTATRKQVNRYNGWTNWQTWNVVLWFRNEEPLYRAYIDESNRQKFNAQRAKDFVLDLMPQGTPDMESKLSYRGVNWSEVSRAFNER